MSRPLRGSDRPSWRTLRAGDGPSRVELPDGVTLRDVHEADPACALLLAAVDADPLSMRPPPERPDCTELPRPCPRLLCRYHLWTDPLSRGGVTLARGLTALLTECLSSTPEEAEVAEVAWREATAESCALDVATDYGELAPAQLAVRLGVTTQALAKTEKRGKDLAFRIFEAAPPAPIVSSYVVRRRPGSR